MPELHELAAPMMRARTRLQRNNAARLCSEERDQLLTRDAATEQWRAGRIGPVRVKDLLCDIQADGGNFFHGRLPLKR
jgi:hypothetical protein